MSHILTASGIAFLLAAQVGPITLLIVRSIVRGGRAVVIGLLMATAVAGVDLAYATVGLAGIGRLLEGGLLQLVLGLASAAIVTLIGVRSIWAGLRARLELAVADQVQPARAFQTAIVATALNPLTIVLWTVSFPAALPLDAAASVSTTLEVLLGVALGTLSWYCGFALVVAALRVRLGGLMLSVVDVATGVALVGYGALLSYRSVQER
jgi:threonine/homoserine/homoserine lactone efflux protein